MLGVPLKGLAYLFGDNLSFITSSTIAQSSLKKKHNTSACYHVREVFASGLVRFFHIHGKENPDNVLTKHLSNYVSHPLVHPSLF